MSPCPRGRARRAPAQLLFGAKEGAEILPDLHVPAVRLPELAELAKLYESVRAVSATVRFTDIARLAGRWRQR